jgi:hypothetical protein
MGEDIQEDAETLRQRRRLKGLTVEAFYRKHYVQPEDRRRLLDPLPGMPMREAWEMLPLKDLVWVATRQHVAPKQKLIEFARVCAQRAQGYAEKAQQTQAKAADASAKLAAFAAVSAVWAAGNTSAPPMRINRSFSDHVCSAAVEAALAAFCSGDGGEDEAAREIEHATQAAWLRREIENPF